MKNWKKYIPHAIVIIILLLIAGSCVNTYVSRKEGEKVQLEKELKEWKAKVKESEDSRLAQKDSLQKENDKKDVIIEKLHKENSVLDNKIIAIKEKSNRDREEIKNYNFHQLAQWYGKRYKLPESVTSTENSVNMFGELPFKVADELAVKDELSSTVKVQEEKLNNKDEEIKQKDEKLLNKDLEIASGEASIKLMKEEQKTSDKLHKTDGEIISGLKTKTVVGSITGVILGVAAGILIAK